MLFCARREHGIHSHSLAQLFLTSFSQRGQTDRSKAAAEQQNTFTITNGRKVDYSVEPHRKKKKKKVV
jgi:hypothetical protein